MTNQLPEGYKKGVPRVSDIVSYIYPFEGEGKRRYQQWLKRVNVNEQDYLSEAQTIGTYIHQHMEDYCNWIESEVGHTCPIIDETIEKGFTYIDEVKKQYTKAKGREMIAEPVLLDEQERFQGSSDLVLVNKKKNSVVVIDWKSFWIAKARFSLPNKYKKPYDKIKKGRLQFSLYAETYRQKGYKIEDIILVYLHQDWTFDYPLELYTSAELDKILTEFKAHKELKRDKREDLIITHNTKDMKVTLRKPTETYGFLEIEIDWYKLEDWKTLEDKIDEAKVLIKYTIWNGSKK